MTLKLTKLFIASMLLVATSAAPAQAASSPRVVTKEFMKSIVYKDSRQYCVLTNNSIEANRSACIKAAKQWFFHSGSDYARDRRDVIRALDSYSSWRVQIKGRYAKVLVSGDNWPIYLVNTKVGVWRILSADREPAVFAG